MFGACDPYPLMGRPKLSWDVPTQLMWGTQIGTETPEKFSSREWETGDLTTCKVGIGIPGLGG